MRSRKQKPLSGPTSQPFIVAPFIRDLMNAEVSAAPENPRKGVAPGQILPPSKHRVLAAFWVCYRKPLKTIAEIITLMSRKKLAYGRLREWMTEDSFISLADRIAREISDFAFREWVRSGGNGQAIGNIALELSHLHDELAVPILRKILAGEEHSELDRLNLFVLWYLFREADPKRIKDNLQGLPPISEAIQKVFRAGGERVTGLAWSVVRRFMP